MICSRGVMSALVLCVLTISVICSDVQSVEVTIPGLGLVNGVTTESAWSNRPIYEFRGIRYAKPPSGVRRFQPAEPVDPWSGVYNATTLGRKCPQLFNKNVSYSDSDEDFEDCLFLNVYTPLLPGQSNATESGLPVMVYIHGGGYYENSAVAFPPNYLLEEDVLLVTIQYRLGPLGFLCLQSDSIAGNMGMIDMVVALEWVNRYIEAFGGNNSRVTVFGQSAGAASTLLLLMSPLVNETLFQQAILHSGSGTSTWIYDDEPSLFANTYFTELTNSNNTVSTRVMEEHFKNATVDELHKALLRVLQKDPLAKAAKVVAQDAGRIKFLEYYPVDLFRIGRIRRLPMMTGVTKNDGSFLVTTVYKIFQANNLLNDSYYLKNNMVRDLIQLFDIPDDTWALTDLLEKEFFADIFSSRENITFADVLPGITNICGLLFFKSAVLRQAKVNAEKAPTYLYTFDYRGEHTRFGYGEDTSEYPFDGGVHHSNDLLYLFPYHYKSLNKQDKLMARTMVKLWTNFAKTGRPSTSNFHWKKFVKGKSGPYVHIDSVLHMEDDFVQHEYKTLL